MTALALTPVVQVACLDGRGRSPGDSRRRDRRRRPERAERSAPGARRGRSVTVLEARERVGGKMRTDTSPGTTPTWAPTGSGPPRTASPRSRGTRRARRAPAPRGQRGARVRRATAHVQRVAATALTAVPRRARHRPAAAQPAPPPGVGRTAMGPGGTHRLGCADRRNLRTAAPAHRAARGCSSTSPRSSCSAPSPRSFRSSISCSTSSPGGGLDSLTEFEGGAQQDHFVGGSQQLCDRLAERLDGACG